MISKQWFTEAVKIFASNSMFEFSRTENVLRVVPKLPPYIGQNITAISWHWHQVDRDHRSLSTKKIRSVSESLPSLKSVHIWTWYHFIFSHSQVSSHYMYTTEGFLLIDCKSPYQQAFLKFRGLTDLKWRRQGLRATDYDYQRWLDGEERIFKEVSKPKGT